MIIVEALADDLHFDELKFNNFNDFVEWCKGYVCKACYKDFETHYGGKVETLSNLLAMGCGCEIKIEDPQNLIDWNYKIEVDNE